MKNNDDQKVFQVYKNFINEFYSNIQRKEDFFIHPLAGIIFTCTERIFSHIDSCFYLIEKESLQSAEALSRVAYEYIVTIKYILEDDLNRFYNYFKNYTEFEKDRLYKWKKFIANEMDHIKKINHSFISKKEEALKIQEDLIELFFSQIESFNPKIEKFPNFFERFKNTGKELSYRTVYAGMSSQIHSNAEDILNKIGVVVRSNNSEEVKKKLKIETDNYSRLMVYITVKELYELLIVIEQKYLNIKLSIEEIKSIEKILLDIQMSIIIQM